MPRFLLLLRRLAVLAIGLATMVGLAALLGAVLAPGGWTVPKLLILLAFLTLLPWLGLGVANAVTGLLIRLFARDPASCVLPHPALPETITLRTALALAVRNEDLATVLAPVGRLLGGLPAPLVVLFVLSDSDATHEAGELAAVGALAARHPGRVRYRRRATPTRFKAGNVMDFLDHDGAGFDCTVVLDADSIMTPAAVLMLIRLMQARPDLGLIQHLTVGNPATAAFPRLFQFGMRAGMRIWATGQAWWQAEDGPFWGHNAILRVAPFRVHARLPLLPDGNAILSHDQIEAALLRGGAWGVAVWVEEAGSLETNPPTLPAFLARDARWLAGNLQYRHLLRHPGLRMMGQWQMLQAIGMFATAPAWPAMLGLVALEVAFGSGAAVPRGALSGLLIAGTLATYLPKLAGYAEILARPDRAAPYGGRARFAAGAAAEFIFALLLDPIVAVERTRGLLRHVPGRQAQRWVAQARTARALSWAEAARCCWPQTLFGAAIFALLAQGGWGPMLWALPFAAGLPLAIPFAVLTASPRFSAALAARRIAATPEELAGL